MPLIKRYGQWLRHHVSTICVFCRLGTDDGLLCRTCQQAMAEDWQRFRRCWSCAQRLRPRQAALLAPFDRCLDCRLQPRVWQQVTAVVDYVEPWNLWVQALKQARQWQLAEPMGRLMAQAWLRQHLRPTGPTLWVPIPTRPQALRQRGFNPALELARSTALQVAGGKMKPWLCWQKTAITQSATAQKWRSRAQRRYDLRGAFVGQPSLAGQQVVLVDDVMTTGFTLQAAARACLAAGAYQVWGVVFARTPKTLAVL